MLNCYENRSYKHPWKAITICKHFLDLRSDEVLDLMWCQLLVSFALIFFHACNACLPL